MDGDGNMEEIMGGMTFADILAEELDEAVRRRGVRTHECYANGGLVHLHLDGIREAEAFVSLAVTSPDRAPGSLYDRASSGCVSLSAIAESYAGEGGVPDSEDELSAAEREAVSQAMDEGWDWQVHPVMTGQRVVWHVAVELSAADAQTVIASLNAGE